MRWLLTVVVLLLPGSAMAQGWIEPPFLPRPLPQPPAARVDKVRTSVTVRITDRVARVEVEEWFRNAGGTLAEGDYIYPLAGEAVFSDFSLFQGEEELKGEPMDASRARTIYEEIVRRRRDPALIELAGQGLIRARVFPFGPGETRSVRLRYTQVLDRAGESLRFRYLAGTPRTGLAPMVRDVRPANGAPLTFTLVADEASRFGEPFSPTHQLKTSRAGGRLTVRPVEELTGSLDVFLPLAGPRVGITLAAHRVDSGAGYFMLTLSPGAVQGVVAPRDIAVALDVSGSMSGAKMEQARQALHQLLGTLNPADRFRLVSFGSRVEAQKPDWSPATRAALADARAWVDQLTASGGTNIAGALDELLRTHGGDGRLHMVIFITDGLPTTGETDPDRIAARVEALRGAARIFTFGVGYDVHTRLLEQVAAAGRGTADYVEPGKDVEEAVGALAQRIRYPVLVDLRLAGAPVKLTDLQPARLPDLYAGQELIVFGRYEAAGAAAGELAITGTRAGRAERFSTRVDFPSHSASGAYIPGLWAARKVGELMRTIRIEGATPERIAEVRELGLRYGLLTEYTSYLVQEPSAIVAQRPAEGGRGRIVYDGAAPAAAPTAVSGKAAVGAAQVAASRRAASNLADVASAERALVDGQQIADRADTRIVAGRTFQLRSEVWTDASSGRQAKVVEIEPFSRAYFQVLEKLPELRPYWSAFDAALVAGTRVSICVTPGGRSTLAPPDLDTLVRDFRGQ